MPNPWDVGSARILASLGFEALATTSAGFAWALGKLDTQVTRGELVEHVEQLAPATDLPLNVDSERCFPDDAGGVAETVRLLGEAGAAGCSIEDWDPVAGRIEDVAARRRARRRGRRGGPRVRPAARADGPRGEPPPRRRRPRRHDRAARRLPGRRRRLRLRAVARDGRRRSPRSSTPSECRSTCSPCPQRRRSRSSPRSASAASRPGASSPAPPTARSPRGARELQSDGTSRYAAGRLSEDDKQAAFG